MLILFPCSFLVCSSFFPSTKQKGVLNGPLSLLTHPRDACSFPHLVSWDSALSRGHSPSPGCTSWPALQVLENGVSPSLLHSNNLLFSFAVSQFSETGMKAASNSNGGSGTSLLSVHLVSGVTITCLDQGVTMSINIGMTASESCPRDAS